MQQYNMVKHAKLTNATSELAENFERPILFMSTELCHKNTTLEHEKDL